MKISHFLSVEEKEQILIAELLKGGVQHSKAVEVARIVAASQANKTLADEERQLVRAACDEWLKNRKHLYFIN